MRRSPGYRPSSVNRAVDRCAARFPCEVERSLFDRWIVACHLRKGLALDARFFSDGTEAAKSARMAAPTPADRKKLWAGSAVKPCGLATRRMSSAPVRLRLSSPAISQPNSRVRACLAAP